MPGSFGRSAPGNPWPSRRRRQRRSVRLGAHQHRARSLGARVLGQHAKPARYFLTCFEHATQIATEAILVKLVRCGGVPQPAAIRTDLIGQDDAHLLVFPQPAELDLEVDETNADAREQADQEIIATDSKRNDFINSRRTSTA